MWYDDIGDPDLYNRDDFLRILGGNFNRIEAYRDQITN
jgi:hypothetical protein